MGEHRAVFLDRDGVVNDPVWDERAGAHESPYDPADVRLVDGVPEALKRLRAAGFLLAVATNQPAAAKGKATVAQLDAVDAAVRDRLAREGVTIDAWRRCLHHPDGLEETGLSGRCDCRKPAPGMLTAMAEELDATLSESWMVGDSDTDIEAGRAAGCRTVLVEHPRSAHRRSAGVQPDARAADLLGAAAFIERTASIR